MQSELMLTQKSISSSTILLANKIINNINNYLSDFNQTELFLFSSANNTEKAKEYSEKYFLFLSTIAPIIADLTSLNANLASLLIEADNNMEIELIVICEKKFNAFEQFEHSLYEYTSCVENELMEFTATPSFLINSVQKFKLATQELIKQNL